MELINYNQEFWAEGFLSTSDISRAAPKFPLLGWFQKIPQSDPSPIYPIYPMDSHEFPFSLPLGLPHS